MCLAVPGKIIEIEGGSARIDMGGVVRKASIMLLPDVRIGDYVIVHAGFAIEKYDRDEAKKTLNLLKELADAGIENE